MTKSVGFIIVSLTGIMGWSLAQAQEFSSPGFTDSFPAITVQGGLSTSTNFQVLSGTGEPAIGESTSTNWRFHGGWFYFPLVTTPVLSATAGDAKVNLQWTAAVGALGINVSGYSVGYGAVSGGPYTFVSVGNVQSHTQSNLTNGTTYYFVARALDAFSNVVSTSSEALAVPTGGGAVPGPGAGSNFFVQGPREPGAPGAPVEVGGVKFSGQTAPQSRVWLLRDGQVIDSTGADAAGNWQFNLSNLTPGSYLFSIYSEDAAGLRTALVNQAVAITRGRTTVASDIFLPPTLALDKIEVRLGDNLTLRGSAMPGSVVTIFIRGPFAAVITVPAAANGAWQYIFNTTKLPKGAYELQVQASGRGQASILSGPQRFLVGERSVPYPARGARQPADLNFDERVDLIDFSILIYWFGRPGWPAFIDISGDGAINLIDFSVMMFYWTG